MNIFSVLKKGNSSLREVSMSAVLAHFLDPFEDHGLKDLFLRGFLDAIDVNVPPHIGLNNIMVNLEAPLDNMSVDIEIVIQDGHGDNSPVHRILVENKINLKAVKKDQLQKYYKAAKDDDDGAYKDVRTTVVLLTPPPGGKYRKDAGFDKLEKIMQGEDTPKHLLWIDEQEADDPDKATSIQGIIRNKILRPESEGKISPVGYYVKHTLKAFAMHLQGYGKSQDSARARLDQNDEVFAIDGYDIIKNRNQVFVHEKDGEQVERGKGKGILRGINDKYKLGVDTHYKRKKDGRIMPRTTHGFGVWIIRAWQDRQDEGK